MDQILCTKFILISLNGEKQRREFPVIGKQLDKYVYIRKMEYYAGFKFIMTIFERHRKTQIY